MAKNRIRNVQAITSGVVALTLASMALLSAWRSAANAGDTSGSEPSFTVTAVSATGAPLEGVDCRLIVGGYPINESGFPLAPEPENTLEATTDRYGRAVFHHALLTRAQRHALHLRSSKFCGITRLLKPVDIQKRMLEVTLFPRRRVALTYSFNPSGGLSLVGSNMVTGKIVLYPMEDGTYRPPAHAFFSFTQNQPVASSALLDVGLALDQQGDTIFFGESNGRFDHCTDLGPLLFKTVAGAEIYKLVRLRKDTPVLDGHTYIYESNIYPPDHRTPFTGFDVFYAKVHVDAVEEYAQEGLSN